MLNTAIAAGGSEAPCDDCCLDRVTSLVALIESLLRSFLISSDGAYEPFLHVEHMLSSSSSSSIRPGSPFESMRTLWNIDTAMCTAFNVTKKMGIQDVL